MKNATRVFAYVEEFSCSPPTLVMIILTLSELAVYLYTIFSIRDHKESSEKMELKCLVHSQGRRAIDKFELEAFIFQYFSGSSELSW